MLPGSRFAFQVEWYFQGLGAILDYICRVIEHHHQKGGYYHDQAHCLAYDGKATRSDFSPVLSGGAGIEKAKILYRVSGAKLSGLRHPFFYEAKSMPLVYQPSAGHRAIPR
jgi:hypothetical protein